MKKIKNFIIGLKYYFRILKEFNELNKYIYLSSKFLSRLEQLLYSNLNSDVILDNIEISYSDFKINYEKDDFLNGVEVKNIFK